MNRHRISRWISSLLAGMACAVAAATCFADDNDALTPLFDGKDLKGWVAEGATEYSQAGQKHPMWTVEKGSLVTAGRGFGFLRYNKRFSDFRLQVEYRMLGNANSGIGIRTAVYDPKKSTQTRPSFYSYEIQLLNDAGGKADNHSTGSLYRYVAPTKIAAKKAPEWNVVDIECVGPRIKISFNGEQVLDFDQATNDELKNKPLEGYICLQSHTNRTEFRRVAIQEIKAK